jgi:hypothetical protein
VESAEMPRAKQAQQQGAEPKGCDVGRIQQ